MRRRSAPDATMLILAELSQWTGEERTTYVSALRELSVRDAVRVTAVTPADPLEDGDRPGPPRRPAYDAAVGQAERAVLAMLHAEPAADTSLRAALAHAGAELGRMRDLLLTHGA